MKPRVVDLFAGGGGLSLGFVQAGFDVVCAIENWSPAIDVYRANFRDHPVEMFDLSGVEEAADRIGKFAPDVIIGGPPCQDFSSAGKRDETRGRASLTVSFAEIVAKCKPHFFVMENVARAAKSQAFQEALRTFKRSGYGVTIQILDAAYCGAPQLRKRLIVVGALDEKDGFLDESLLRHLSRQPTTLRQYFGKKLNFEHYYRHPRSYARRAVFSVDEPSPTVRGVNRPVPKGYLGHEGDSIELTGEIRCLTTQERALIQTFPADFKLPGTKTDVEQVIGNAVPVKLANYVASRLMEYINLKQNMESIHVYQLFDSAMEANSLWHYQPQTTDRIEIDAP